MLTEFQIRSEKTCYSTAPGSGAMDIWTALKGTGDFGQLPSQELGEPLESGWRHPHRTVTVSGVLSRSGSCSKTRHSSSISRAIIPRRSKHWKVHRSSATLLLLPQLLNKMDRLWPASPSQIFTSNVLQRCQDPERNTRKPRLACPCSSLFSISATDPKASKSISRHGSSPGF